MKGFNILKANFVKEYIEMKRYLPNTIAYLVTYYLIFLGLFFGITFIGHPDTVHVTIQHSMVSIMFWGLSMMIMNFMGFSIITEATRGTLEQLYMSPTKVWKILLSRIVSNSMLQLVMMGILLVASMLTSGQWLNLNPLSTLPILIVTIIGMSGVSFMIAGLAIMVKQIQAFLQIFQFVLMALTFVPFQSQTLFISIPFIKGIAMVKDVMINNKTLVYFAAIDFVVLFSNAIIYFLLGLLVYKSCEKQAIDKGLLGQY